ncbi:carbamoyltransferase C-terminal domain-containing protein [Paenibacillus sp. FSL H7-0943]|uniref:carbamoyltransferase family protein n=1 Tax=Paenibacillus sp. FSL H7-0943 TaxID=2954739 RepID=UPI0030D51E7D
MLILGLSGGLGHDSAACLVHDGVLVAYAEEERFCRKKHAYGEPPVLSLLNCLSQAGVAFEDIDLIALSWDPQKAEELGILEKFKKHPVLSGKKMPTIISVSHHLCHAASAYYLSGFDDAVILVMDGQGDDISTTVAYGKNEHIEVKQEYGISQSLGFFYSIVSDYLQLGASGEGKLMGLASYGESVYDFSVRLTEDGYEIPFGEPDSSLGLEDKYNKLTRIWMKEMYRKFGDPPKRIYSNNTLYGGLNYTVEYSKKHKDIAASAQQALEDTIVHLCQQTIRQGNSKNLVIGGGVALNCTTNGRLERLGMFDEIFVLPATNDAGGCIGAAMIASKERSVLPVKGRLKTPYWGISYDDNHISEVLKKLGLKYNYSSDICRQTAELIDRGKVIGWFQGAAEMGPRALGNRSITASPASYDSYVKVNQKIKFRESWRPLAPSIMDEHSDWLVEEAQYSPYMLKAYTVKEERRQAVPAIVHVDGSTRPQTVRSEVNPVWHQLIAEHYKLSGIPLIMNTSLNTRGEPVCETPYDAIKTFYTTAMDALAVGNFLIEK